MSNDAIIIARNVQLTFKLKAKEIWVSPAGEVIIVASQLGPNAPCPSLSVEYLEALCCDFYYGGKRRANSIANILLLNRLLHTYEYGDFYDSLQNNLDSQNITIVVSEIFR
jgi:hypothetical protein